MQYDDCTRLPGYYNPAGPGLYEPAEALGRQSTANKHRNSPAFGFGVQARSRSGLLEGESGGKGRRLDFLYPRLEATRSRSPMPRFPKEKREVFTVKDETRQVPVSYIEELSTLSKGKVIFTSYF